MTVNLQSESNFVATRRQEFLSAFARLQYFRICYYCTNKVYLKLAIFDIPIYEGDRINCVDLLDALTKDVLKTQGNSELPLENEELSKMKEKAIQVCIVQTYCSL